MNETNIPEEIIERRIFLIRNQKVMLDLHLAELYEVPTKALLQSVKRNIDRFPADFMFQLQDEEALNLRSQIVTSSWGGRRYLPYAFTEQGVAMLSSVLRSKGAIQVNIAIMRAFVKPREILGAHKELACKLEQLETKMEKHNKEIRAIFDAIRRLMIPPELPVKKRIGFVDEPKAVYEAKKLP